MEKKNLDNIQSITVYDNDDDAYYTSDKDGGDIPGKGTGCSIFFHKDVFSDIYDFTTETNKLKYWDEYLGHIGHEFGHAILGAEGKALRGSLKGHPLCFEEEQAMEFKK